MRKAVWALLVCRPAVLGGPVQRCPDGHVERVWSHSCRHRRCPPCAWLQVERWWDPQRARLLACDHDQVLFTRPSARHDLWQANVAVRTPRLCAGVRDPVRALRGDEADLGATPGLRATRHTWPQTRLRHPHGHCLVTGGGLTESGDWGAVRHGLLLPSRVAMAVFRGTRRAAVRRAVQQGQRRRPAGLRPQRCDHRLHMRGRQPWHVPIRERYPPGAGVLLYRARAGRGGPLANPRLVSCGQGEVRFRDRGNGEGAARPRCGLLT